MFISGLGKISKGPANTLISDSVSVSLLITCLSSTYQLVNSDLTTEKQPAAEH